MMDFIYVCSEEYRTIATHAESSLWGEDSKKLNDIVIIDDALEIILVIGMEEVGSEDVRAPMVYVGTVASWTGGLCVGSEAQTHAIGGVVTQDILARLAAPNSVSGSTSPSRPLGEHA